MERHEILEMMGTLKLAGMRHAECEVDRAVAIRQAVCEAAAQDVILLAGKGHEDYQEIRGARHPFLDKAQAQAALQRRKTKA